MYEKLERPHSRAYRPKKQVFSPMKIIPLSTQNSVLMMHTLQQGGVIAHPTDTCYGLAADISNQKAVQKVAQIKKMAFDKTISIMVSDFYMLKKYGVLNARAAEIMQKHLPGPLTMILPKTEQVPGDYFPKEDTIGLRIPNLPWLLEIIKEFNSPLTTTSANISGKKETYSAQEVYEMFQNQTFQPDLIIDVPENPQRNKPSTIVRIVEERVEVLREGEIKITKIPSTSPTPDPQTPSKLS